MREIGRLEHVCPSPVSRRRCFYDPTSNHSLDGDLEFLGKTSKFVEVATN